jgi:prepilin-type N-terminal cleavage/methylation domain-containing protein/prepilin-type processing-associated H-X9-DG protein
MKYPGHYRMKAMKTRVDSGFTLIELLVVISIIALLVGILLPALGAARRSAQKTVCMSNVRSVGQSSLAYSVDNGDMLIPGAPETAHAHLFRQLPYVDIVGPLEPYLSDFRAFTCPLTESTPLDKSRSYNVYSSYLYFPGRVRGPDFGDTDKAIPLDVSMALPEMVMLQDMFLRRLNNYAGERGWWSNHATGNATPFGEGTSVSTYVVNENDFASTDGANLLFYDGHAESFSASSLVNVGKDQFPAGSNAGDVMSVIQWDKVTHPSLP